MQHVAVLLGLCIAAKAKEVARKEPALHLGSIASGSIVRNDVEDTLSTRRQHERVQVEVSAHGAVSDHEKYWRKADDGLARVFLSSWKGHHASINKARALHRRALKQAISSIATVTSASKREEQAPTGRSCMWDASLAQCNTNYASARSNSAAIQSPRLRNMSERRLAARCDARSTSNCTSNPSCMWEPSENRCVFRFTEQDENVLQMLLFDGVGFGGCGPFGSPLVSECNSLPVQTCAANSSCGLESKFTPPTLQSTRAQGLCIQETECRLTPEASGAINQPLFNSVSQGSIACSSFSSEQSCLAFLNTNIAPVPFCEWSSNNASCSADFTSLLVASMPTTCPLRSFTAAISTCSASTTMTACNADQRCVWEVSEDCDGAGNLLKAAPSCTVQTAVGLELILGSGGTCDPDLRLLAEGVITSSRCEAAGTQSACMAVAPCVFTSNCMGGCGAGALDSEVGQNDNNNFFDLVSRGDGQQAGDQAVNAADQAVNAADQGFNDVRQVFQGDARQAARVSKFAFTFGAGVFTTMRG